MNKPIVNSLAIVYLNYAVLCDVTGKPPRFAAVLTRGEDNVFCLEDNTVPFYTSEIIRCGKYMNIQVAILGR